MWSGSGAEAGDGGSRLVCVGCGVGLGWEWVGPHLREVHSGLGCGWECGECGQATPDLQGLLDHSRASRHALASARRLGDQDLLRLAEHLVRSAAQPSAPPSRPLHPAPRPSDALPPGPVRLGRGAEAGLALEEAEEESKERLIDNILDSTAAEEAALGQPLFDATRAGPSGGWSEEAGSQGETAEEAAEARLPCQLCGKEIKGAGLVNGRRVSLTSSLWTHVVSRHSTANSVRCSGCGLEARNRARGLADHQADRCPAGPAFRKNTAAWPQIERDGVRCFPVLANSLKNRPP